MKYGQMVLFTAAAIYTLSAFIPLLKSDVWWIRVWDFPRLQFLVWGAVCALLILFFAKLSPAAKTGWVLALGIGMALDIYRIFPYSPLRSKQVQYASTEFKDNRVRLFVANVLQKNEDWRPLEKLIHDINPDVVLLLEVNDRWLDSLSSIEELFPYRISHPLENEYGIALYSRLELENPKIEFLVEDDIPSVESVVRLPSGERIVVYGVHPRPPRPDSQVSTERDAELVLVGRMAAEQTLPVVVMGDLNDVAWSHTSRLFQRVSRLLDPRIGRGPLPTFPVYLPFLRFPLDYVFHSDTFELVELKRLPDIGSDHFPVLAELQLNHSAAQEQEAPQPDSEDIEESRETIERGLAPSGSDSP